MSGAERLASRWAGRTGATAFVIAALALGRAIGDQVPSALGEYQQPHEVRVAVGEPAELRLMSLTVDEVRVGRALDNPWGGAIRTPGVFVVADVTMTPKDEDAALAHVEAVDAGGRSFQATRLDRGSCGVEGPGILQRCSLVLEVPADALPGLTLRLGGAQDVRFDDLAVVDTGLTTDAVDQQLAADVPLALVDEEVAP